MEYSDWRSKTSEVRATLFGSEADIGGIVQDLYDSGCHNIYVVKSANNPQLEVTTYFVSITFTQFDSTQTLFLTDILSFDESNYATAWTEEEFLRQFRLEE